jgi:hypothetical protein
MNILRGCAVGVLVVLAVLLAAVPVSAESAALPPGARVFYFDDGFYADPGLSFMFSRPVATRLPDGTTIGEDVPRYPDVATLAGAPHIETVRDEGHITRILASGLDHDGVTPLMVVLNRSTERLDVFTVAGDALLDAEAGGPGRNRTDVRVNESIDVMQGLYPGRRYDPLAGAICHGLIVLHCVVLTSDDPDSPDAIWLNQGTAIVISQDQGLTWELLYEEPVIDPDYPRGAMWCMQNWWPVEHEESPTEAYFISADYRFNTGSQGGRCYLFRATRFEAGLPWLIEPVVIPYETQQPPEQPNEHYHIAGIVPYGDDGLRILVVIGDGQVFNRITSLTRPDRNYVDLAGWTVQRDYHGARGDFGNDPGIVGNQAVGCAPGPLPGDILLGTDLNDEQICLIRRDDSPPPHSPVTEFVFGHTQANGERRSEVFLIRTPTPERGGPYCAVYSPATPSAIDGSRRLLYSEDGESWTQILAPYTGNYTASIHGEHIYIGGWAGSVALRRIPLPDAVHERRPLHIASGGLQRGRIDPVVVPGDHGVVTPLTKDAQDRWLGMDGQPIEPQPPSTGQVYHVSSSRFEGTTPVAQIRPCGDLLTVGQTFDHSYIQLRAWMLNNMLNGSAHPRLEVRDSAVEVFDVWRPKISIVDEWMPITVVSWMDFGTENPWGFRVFPGEGEPTDSDYYFALDCVIEGPGYPGYIMEQDASPDGLGTWFPDELGTIAGLDCSPAWSVALALQIPADGWDASVRNIGFWPLATIWGNDKNYVAIYADVRIENDCRLRVEVIRNGELSGEYESEPLYWLRGSNVLVAMSTEGGLNDLEFTVAAAETAVAPLILIDGREFPPLVPPTEIRMGSHHGTSGDGESVHVTPMNWWGGAVWPDVALNQAEREALLTTLSFLSPPASPDFNGDGCVGLSDLGFLLSHFEIDDSADLDGDGDTDISDLGALLAVFDPDCS